MEGVENGSGKTGMESWEPISTAAVAETALQEVGEPARFARMNPELR